MKGVLMDKQPIIQELEDGRIIKDDGKTFTELVNGQWVEPSEPVSLDDFLKGKTPANL